MVGCGGRDRFAVKWRCRLFAGLVAFPADLRRTQSLKATVPLTQEQLGPPWQEKTEQNALVSC